MKTLRFSDNPLCLAWLAQFRTSKDRALSAQLLNLLRLVSSREFETSLEQTLTNLQKKLNRTIAVYPVAHPIPGGVVGYDPFKGGIHSGEKAPPQRIGRRKKPGSEGRVAHLLAKLQDSLKSDSSVSTIECMPSLKQIKTQKIRHIVLVDDVCGSASRIIDFWKNSIPRTIKSLLSLKKCELWIVVHAIMPLGWKNLTIALPNFPISDNLLVALPNARLTYFMNEEMISLCNSYAKLIGMDSSGLGYKESACPVVFEHGCPNNVPAILWVNNRSWKGLFPNRSIPSDLRACFDIDSPERGLEVLWRANQPNLTLELIEALDSTTPIEDSHYKILVLLGLRLRGIAKHKLANRLLISNPECSRLLLQAADMGLYIHATSEVTTLGRNLVSRFRANFKRLNRSCLLDNDPAEYYPHQCEGELLKPGKTIRGKSRKVPIEPL